MVLLTTKSSRAAEMAVAFPLESAGSPRKIASCLSSLSIKQVLVPHVSVDGACPEDVCLRRDLGIDLSGDETTKTP